MSEQMRKAAVIAAAWHATRAVGTDRAERWAGILLVQAWKWVGLS